MTEREKALEAQVAEWQRCYDRAQRLRAATEAQVAGLRKALETIQDHADDGCVPVHLRVDACRLVARAALANGPAPADAQGRPVSAQEHAMLDQALRASTELVGEFSTAPADAQGEPHAGVYVPSVTTNGTGPADAQGVEPVAPAGEGEPVMWLPVDGFEDCYEVSSSGDLRSVRSGKLLAKNLMGSGYVKADLWKDGVRFQTSVHRLVAAAFVQKPEGMTEVNHIDGDKTNNCASNLEWTDRRGNTHHSRYILGNDVKPVIAVDPTSGDETYYPSIEEAGRQGFRAGGIYAALHGRKKTHGGKRWSFAEWRDPGARPSPASSPTQDAQQARREAREDMALLSAKCATLGCDRHSGPVGDVKHNRRCEPCLSAMADALHYESLTRRQAVDGNTPASDDARESDALAGLEAERLTPPANASTIPPSVSAVTPAPPPHQARREAQEVVWELESLLHFCRMAQVGRAAGDPRDFERRIGMALDKIKAALPPDQARREALEQGGPGDVEYLLGMLRAIAKGDLDARAAKHAAAAGLDLYLKGPRVCAEERGEKWPDDADETDDCLSTPAAAQPDDWRPFDADDTALQDGGVILVYRPDRGIFTAHYVEDDAHLASPMNPPEGDPGWFATDGHDLTDDLPTHWRPMPAPPAAAQKGDDNG